MIRSDHLIADRIRSLFMPPLAWLSLDTSIPVWMYGINVLPLMLSASELHCLEVTRHPKSPTGSTWVLSSAHTALHTRYHFEHPPIYLRRMKTSLPCRLNSNAIDGASHLRGLVALRFKKTRQAKPSSTRKNSQQPFALLPACI